MVEIERCWCEKWPRRCTNLVSQEDMRCDICRDGCRLVVAGSWSAHAGQVEFDIQIDLSRWPTR
jgi:hypothetical protein